MYIQLSYSIFDIIAAAFTLSLSLVEAAYPIMSMFQVINKEARTT